MSARSRFSSDRSARVAGGTPSTSTACNWSNLCTASIRLSIPFCLAYSSAKRATKRKVQAHQSTICSSFGPQSRTCVHTLLKLDQRLTANQTRLRQHTSSSVTEICAILASFLTSGGSTLPLSAVVQTEKVLPVDQSAVVFHASGRAVHRQCRNTTEAIPEYERAAGVHRSVHEYQCFTAPRGVSLQEVSRRFQPLLKLVGC